jgi:hypothetical protein
MAGISHRIVLTQNPTDYVYVHVHPRRPAEVVYVGRGSAGRAWSFARRSHDHLVWLREWQALGYTADQWVRILHRGLTPQQADKKEKEAIAFHKKLGHQLFNDLLNKGKTRPHRNRSFPDGPLRDTKGKWRR